MLRNLVVISAVAAILCLASLSFGLPLPSPEVIVGQVLTADRTPVRGAQVSLNQVGTSALQQTLTNEAGTFSLSIGESGNYVVRVRKPGYRDAEFKLALPLSSAEPLKITLEAATASPSVERHPADGMEFSDKPDFTVAGITDWTAAGGHGSDVNLRASEALAKDTRTLSDSNDFTSRDRERERELRAAVLKDPASFQANHALGEFCLRQRQFVDAIPSLEKAHQLRPGDFENLYDLAQAYDGAGRYAEAKLLVNQLLAQGDRPELHRLLGDVEEHLNDPLASEREYERAVQLQPSEENYFAWAGELLQHRAVEAAIDVFTKGAKEFAHSERMLAGLGAALYAHGSYEDGAQRVCDASDLNPSDPQPYLFMGKMEQASPRPLPCVKEKLARFAHDRPNNPWANYYYAFSLLQPEESAQSKEAEELLKNAVSIDPRFALAYLQLGVLKSNRGDWKGAKEAYEKAAASDPSLPDPHFRLAQVYRRMSDPQRASQELRTFDSLKKSDAAAVEQQRREVRQFVIVMKDAPAAPAN